MSRSVSRNSENGSSDPSLQAGQRVPIELSVRGRLSIPPDSREATRFSLGELALATKNFVDINLIGQGKFGEVYKGLLQDGMIVAIKKRYGPPSQEFIEQVGKRIIRGTDAVLHGIALALLCQLSREKLEFKHRLSISLGAAKGLAYLHGLNPPLIHKNFSTRNVLVDENFIAKNADAGLRNLLSSTEGAGPSSQISADDVFLAPE
ncbi:hypothetical protein ACLOJK_019627 [Asimina triloba]